MLARNKEIVADTPNAAEKKYLYYLSRTDYEKEWGTEYRRPGFGTRLLAVVLKLFPKKGPFSGLDFKIPTQQSEDLFIQSIDDTVRSYRQLLQEAQSGTLHLANRDCDTGKETRPGEYVLADKTYAHLLNDLADNNFENVPPELREDILTFYANPDAPIATKRKSKDWKRVQEELKQLKTAAAVTAAHGDPISADSESSGTRP